MNELITKALSIKEFEKVISFPAELLTDFDKSILVWIQNYYKKYGELPSINRLCDGVPLFVPIETKPARPFADIFDLTLERKRRIVAIKAVNEMLIELDSGTVPIDKVNKLAMLLATTSSELAIYSEFNRENYWRSSKRIYLGFPMLDRAMGGIANGDLVNIVGRLGTGKTTIAQWIVYKWLLQGKRVLYISNEMSFLDVWMRLDAMFGHFNPHKLRTPDEYPELKHTIKVVKHLVAESKGEIIIPERRMLSPSAVSSLARHLLVDAIIIDGLYLMKPDGHFGAKWERVSEVSNAIKQAALELNVPILGVTQMKRTGDKDEFDMEDIAFSDSIGQDSDFVIFLVPEKIRKTRVEMHLVKNRHGERASIQVLIDFDRMTIIDETVKREYD